MARTDPWVHAVNSGLGAHIVGKHGQVRKGYVRFVTDPMCSWCWGMTPDIETTMHDLPELAYDLSVGGINLDSTKPVGRYGKSQLDKLWDEVTVVTGQTFSHQVQPGTVYNSMLPCLAIEAMRGLIDAPPFGYTHRLQQRFFAEGVNVNDLQTLLATAAEFDVDEERLRRDMDSQAVRERARWGFENARRYGTNALPSVLVSNDDSDFRLLAGGYVNAEALTEELRRNFSHPDA
ncbi:MAG: DsbA family protein [Gammaproteobacteria bacterium]|nr:DsbA family protein [Gammaproteobacteria bacterium]